MAHDPTQKSELIRSFLDGSLPSELMAKVERLIATDPTVHTLLDEQGKIETFINRLQEALAMPSFPSEQNDGSNEALRKAVETQVRQARANDDTAAVPSNTSTASEAKPKRVALLPFLSPPQESNELGRLNGYRVLKQLGEGGMGIVFEAEDIKLKRRVALKVMKPEIAAKEQHRVRFIREAQTAARVEHDHICPIYEVGEENGVPFIAMPFLKGEPLDAYLKRKKPLPPDEAIRIGREVAEGLFAAHREGLVHRDIKPGNIWLETRPNGQSRARILDFGLARAPGEDVQITASGAILGTPAYMAPEQARGRVVDHRADLFSLGVILYEMTTGRRPFNGTDTMSILTSLAIDDPTAPHLINPTISTEFSALIMALLSKTPERRPGTGRVVSEALVGILARTSRPIVEAIGGGVGSVANAADATAVDPWGGIDETEPIAVPVRPNPEPDSRDTKPISRDVKALRSGARMPQRSRLNAKVMIAAALLLLIGGGFAVYKLVLETKDGTLVVEVDSLDTDLRFKNGELQIYGEDGKLKYTLKPGERSKTMPPGKYTVRVVSADGVRLETDKFEMTRDGRVVLRVTADAVAVARKPRDPADAAEAARRAAAEAALPALEAKFKAGDVTFASFAKEVGEFKAKHGGTPAAIKAAEMLMKLQSPLDDLDAAMIPDDAKAAWKASGFDGRDVVGVFGEHRQRHWGPVDCVTYSPNGKFAASCGQDNAVYLWDPASLQLLAILKGHTASVSKVVFTHDGQSLISAGVHPDNTIRIWDLAKRQEIKTIGSHGVSLTSIAVSKDGRRLLSGHNDGVISVWDLVNGKEVRRLIGHKKRVNTLAFTSDDRRALSGAGSSDEQVDWTLRLWDVESGKELKCMDYPNIALSAVPTVDGRRCLVGGHDHKVRIWDLERGEEIKCLTPAAPSGNVFSVAFLPGEVRALVADGEAKTLRLWDLEAAKELHRFEGHGGLVSTVSIDSKGVRAISGGSDGSVRFWDIQTGKEVQPLTKLAGVLWNVSLNAQSTSIAVRNAEGIVSLWDADTGKLRHTFDTGAPAFAYSMANLVFSPDGNALASASRDSHLKFWEVISGKELRDDLFEAYSIVSLAISPDGKKFAVGGFNGHISLRDFSNGQELLRIDANPPDNRHEVYCLDFSPDGRFLASGSWLSDKALRIWNAETGKQLRILSGHNDHVFSATFSPDGQSLASGSADHSVRIWNLATGRERHTLTEHKAPIYSTLFAPDGQWLASAGADGRVILWDPSSGAKFREWQLPGPIHGIAVASDGRHIVTANGNGTAYILRIAESPHSAERDLKALQTRHADPKADREVLRKDLLAFRVRYASFPEHTLRAAEMLMMSPSPLDALDPAKIPEDAKADWKTNGFDGKDVVAVLGEHRQRHWAPIGPIVVSPDGKWVASAQFGRVHIWNAETLELLAVIMASGGDVFSLACSPDSKKLAFSNGSGPVSFWDISGKSPKKLTPLTGHTNNTFSIVFSPDGKRLAYSSTDNSIWLWDVSAEEPKLRRALKDHPELYHTLMFTPDSKRLICHGSQDIIRIWNWSVTDNTEFIDLKLPGDQIWSVAVSANGKYLASACASGQGSLWDLSAANPTQRVLRKTGASRVAFAPDNKKLAIGDSGGSILLWDLDGPEPVEKGILKAHTQRPDTVRFGPDSKTLVSTVKDVESKLWDIETKKELGALLGNSPAFTPDGRRLLTTTGNALRLWDVATGKEIKPLTAHTGSLASVAFSPDDRSLLTASWDRTSRLWDVLSGTESEHFDLGQRTLNPVALFNPDGETIAFATVDRVVLWDIRKKQAQYSLTPGGNSTLDLALSADGRTIATIQGASGVQLWDIMGQRLVHLNSPNAHSAAFDPTGTMVVSADEDKMLFLFDSRSGKELRRLDHRFGTAALRAAFLPDGQRILAMGGSTPLRCWQIDGKRQLWEVEGGPFAISPDGKQLVVVSKEKLTLYDSASGQHIQHWQIAGPVHDVAFANDGRHIATANANGTVYILRIAESPWYAEQDLAALQTRLTDPKSDRESLRKDVLAFRARYASLPTYTLRASEMLTKLPSPLDVLDAAKIPVEAKAHWKATGFEPKDVVAVLGEHSWAGVGWISVSPDGKLLACGGNMLDTDTGRVVSHRSFPFMVSAFSPDSRRLATAGWKERSIHIVDGATGEEQFVLQGHTGQIWSLAFSPDGKTLFSGAEDATLRIWDLETRKERQVIKDIAVNWLPRGMAVSRDGKMLASRTDEGTIKIWNPETAAELGTIQHESVLAVAFTADNQKLVSADKKATVRVWDANTRQSIREFLSGVADSSLIEFSPDGKTLAIGRHNAQHRGQPGVIKLFDVANWKERASIGQPNQINGIGFSLDSRVLFSTYWTGSQIRRTYVETGKEVPPDGAIPVNCVAFAPDDGALLAGRSGPMGLLDPINGTEQKRFDPGNVADASFSLDGRWICAVPRDGSIRLHDAKTGGELRNLKGFPNNPYCAAFVPDPNRLLVGTDSGYAIVWDIDRATELLRLQVASGQISDVHASPDGRLALCTSVTTKLFDLKTGQELREVNPKGFTSVGAKFSPDGKTIAIAAGNGRIILQDTASGFNLHDWQLPASVRGLAFANDGRHLAITNGNGTVYILRMPKLPGPDQLPARLIFDGRVGSASVSDFRLGNIGGLTIEGFFTPTSDGQATWSTTGFVSNALTVDPQTNHWVFVWQDGNGIIRKVQSKYPYIKDRRVHVAGVLDGLQLRLYIDGKLEESFDLSTKPKLEERSGLLLGNVFGGIVDNVRFSNVARYRDDFIPTQRAEPDKDTLVLYRCDEGQGDKLTDLSGNDHHARIVGAKWARADGTVSEVRPAVTPDARFALQFDTSSTSVSLPNVQVDLAKSGSFELWMELQSPKRDSMPLILTGKNQLLYLQTMERDVLQMVVVPKNLGAGQNSDCRISKTRLPAGWVHVAASWSQGACRLFVNGKLIEEQVDFKFGFSADLVSAIGRYPAVEPGPALPPTEAFLNICQVRIANDARFTKEFVPNRRFEADAGTVALYRFDEGEGDKLTDSSGNNLHCKIVGAKWVKNASATSAIEFAENDVVRIPSLILDRAGVFTLEAFATPGQQNKRTQLVGVPFQIAVNTDKKDGVDTWKFTVLTEDDELAIFGPPVEAGKRVHVAGIWTGDQMSLFLDGMRIAEREVKRQTLRKPKPEHGPFTLGLFYFGTMNEVRVSKVARYDKDFTPVKRFEPDPDTLALYHCDEGAGDTLTDSSCNNHHGKIGGAKWVKATRSLP
jgi:WD40 repeat protein/serine/threonine protein kinase